MQTLRNACFLARLLLAWFALFIGVSVAGALLKPDSVELLCSGAGAIKLLVKSGGGTQHPAGAHTLDCPLCASISAPPAERTHESSAVQPHLYASQSIPSSHPVAVGLAPLPARGPPMLLA